MIKINKTAKRILDKLTEGLDKLGDHKEIDNTDGAFMSAHVEHIGDTYVGPMFSVTHYYKQNGDMMKDPDMTFLRTESGEYFPLEFQQDNMGIYQRAVHWEGNRIQSYNKALQKDLASFAGTWMRNIKSQQGL
jgi:Domain of unknown function (DUF6908)